MDENLKTEIQDEENNKDKSVKIEIESESDMDKADASKACETSEAADEKCSDHNSDGNMKKESENVSHKEDTDKNSCDSCSDEDKEEDEKLSRKDRKSIKAKKELAKKDEQIAELTDRLRRTAAEFDNFRKRTEKEKAVRYDDGAMGVLEKILPVADNFERGLAQVTEEQKSDPFVEGMEKIYKHFLTTLEDLGVKPIDAAGKEFDPNLHNAVMHVDDDDLGDNIVAEELQKGYMYKDNVLRHSMVKVAN